MSFMVIPALDLRGGKCVQLEGGEPGKTLIEVEDPMEVARRWERLGAKRLHLIDLDRAIEGSLENESIVRAIVKELSIPVQYGGGLRTMGEASAYLDMGIENVILGTAAIERPEILKGLKERFGKERVVVALDSRDGYVVIRGWKEKTRVRASSLARKLEPYAGEFLFTNVDVEGRLKGVEEESIIEVVEATGGRVVISGGITTLGDLRRVKALGARGAVIGSALYTGRIDFGEALELEG